MNKLFILLIFTLFSCENKETDIDKIVVHSVNLNIDTSADVSCKDFELTFNGVIKVYSIKDKSIFNKIDKLLKGIKNSNKNTSIDIRRKIIVFHKDKTIDTLCVDRFNIVMNGQLIDKNDDLLSLSLDL
ncbi:hypothetical protein [uncultured Flavobacterium sp.]|uniref:hypothetical protein n=1 Tax=uncultured Flavobacterium sp. TaxID=165435 RepID=UPI0030814D16